MLGEERQPPSRFSFLPLLFPLLFPLPYPPSPVLELLLEALRVAEVPFFAPPRYTGNPRTSRRKPPPDPFSGTPSPVLHR
jgi:hypothetical protein